MTAALAAPFAVSLDKERTALYRFFRADGALLYVGITSSLGARWSTHNQGATWWDEASRIVVDWYPTRGLAARAELVAIRTEDPVHNVFGTAKHKQPRRMYAEQIVAEVRARITSGEWPPGYRLPSIARMKAVYFCSETPVKTATRILEATGWVEGRVGVGVFVAEHPPRRPDPVA